MSIAEIQMESKELRMIMQRREYVQLLMCSLQWRSMRMEKADVSSSLFMNETRTPAITRLERLQPVYMAIMTEIMSS